MWDVEYTDEFEYWWQTLTTKQQIDVSATVGLLEHCGPNLSYPYSSGIHQSKCGHMRELRIQSAGDPFRILYAFDPRRVAILLTGGNKKGDNRWYVKYISLADELYSHHLETLDKEGLLND